MKNSASELFKKPLIIAFIALLCCALWGSATPFIKVGKMLMLPNPDTASTILFAGIRFTFAGILTVLIYSIARRKPLIPKSENVGKILLVALFQTVIQYIFFYVGLSNTSGVKGTIASGSSAFFALLISALIFRQEKLSVKKVVACVIGFAGIIAVNLKGLDFNMNFTGDCFVIFSAISSSISSVLIKKFSKDEDPVTLSGYQFIIGGAAMVILGFALGGRIEISNIKSVGVMVYLSVLSAVAYSLWGVLLKYNPVSKVSIYSFTTPVFGVILSKLMLSEDSKVSLINLIIALLLVSGGILLINFKMPSKAVKPTQEATADTAAQPSEEKK